MLTNDEIEAAIASGMTALEAVSEATSFRFSQNVENSIFFDVKCPDGRHYGYLYSKISRTNGDVIIRWRARPAFANYVRRHRPFKHNISTGTYEQFRDGMIDWLTEIQNLLPIN